MWWSDLVARLSRAQADEEVLPDVGLGTDTQSFALRNVRVISVAIGNDPTTAVVQLRADM
jgi:hypothetical protein